ncbi:MAG: hypothetical protein WCT49_01585 [Candidatus Paceibacterota bacterium]|jgi:hypothetical protein|nr:hypothetical protein [Candidatus Paceibacterota bacterium]
MLEKILLEWNQINFALAALIFFAYVFVDGLYAYYTLKVVDLNEYRSATSGAVIHLVLAFGVLNYINNFLYIVPLVLGSWVGTFFLVRSERIKSEQKNKAV